MTRHQDARLWTAGFVLAMATNFFVMMVFFLLMTSLAIYAVERFGAGESLAGLTSSIYVIGAVASRMFAGKYLDLIGRRRLLLGSLLVFSIVGALYAPTDSLWLLLVIRFVHGAAFGAASTTVTAAVQSLIPPHRRGEGIGYFGTAGTLATAIGPFLAVIITGAARYDLLFHLSTACAIAALLVALVLRLPERAPTEDELARRWRIRFSDLLDPSALPISLVTFCSAALYSSILAFVNAFGQEAGFAEGAGMFFAVYAVTVFLARLVVGRLQDRRGDNAVIYPALVSLGLGLLVLGIAQNDLMVAAAGVFAGIWQGSMMTGGQTIAVTLAPDHRVGIAVSTFYLMLDAGIGLGPIAVGVLIAALGFQGMYTVLAATTIGVIVLYYFMHGRTARQGPLR